MEPRVLIVTPTYNERDNLTEFVDAVRSAAPAAHVLVVDDASPDGTGELSDALAAARRAASGAAASPCSTGPGKLGLGTAYVDGFRHALARGYDVIFEMDADLSHDPAYIPRFLERHRRRRRRGVLRLAQRARRRRRGLGPALGATCSPRAGGSLYARTILGVGVRDLTTGFKAYTRRALAAIGLSRRCGRTATRSRSRPRTARCVRGMRVVEVPIVFVDRTAGRSKMSRRIFVEAIGVVWKLRVDAVRGRI